MNCVKCNKELDISLGNPAYKINNELVCYDCSQAMYIENVSDDEIICAGCGCRIPKGAKCLVNNGEYYCEDCTSLFLMIHDTEDLDEVDV